MQGSGDQSPSSGGGALSRSHHHTGLGVQVHMDPLVAGGVQATDLPPPVTFPLSFFPFHSFPTAVYSFPWHLILLSN